MKQELNPDVPKWLSKIFLKTDLLTSNEEESERYSEHPYLGKVYNWKIWLHEIHEDDN